MIKELREKMKATQSDFSEYFEIPLKTVQGWEQGRRNPPNYLVKMMYKLWEKDGKPMFEFKDEYDFIQQFTRLDPITKTMIMLGKAEKISKSGKMFLTRYKNSKIDYKKILENMEVDVDKQD